MGKYLKQYGAAAGMFALFAAIFAAVFALYGLSIEPVLYGSGLCVLAGSVAVAVHFLSFRRKHEARRQALKDPELMLERLPSPRSPIEQDDREIMDSLARQLRESQTELMQARQDSLDYFTAWVHQIKTPLSVMRLTLQAEDSDRSRTLLGELFHMEQYVNMALGYARLGQPTRDLVIRQVELDPVIRSVIREFAPLMIRKKIRIRYEGTQMTALSDEKWLRFMLEQVMSNAVKYTTAGEIAVTAEEGPEIFVSDTGIGVAEEDVPRVFEKGYTGYNGRGGQKSTGLGLYLCRQTAEMLGHGVKLDSEIGKGTRVAFDLRREKMQAE